MSRVSILSRLERRLQPGDNADRTELALVSILSRLERRLQPSQEAAGVICPRFNPQPPRKTAATPPKWMKSCGARVSILSRLERRLQRQVRRLDVPGEGCFNPQPPRKTAATRTRPPGSRPSRGFNPQPPRKTAATPRCWCRLWPPASFNPQPPRKTAATQVCRALGANTSPTAQAAYAALLPHLRRSMFQSSAASKDGCNPELSRISCPGRVSILSRLERRLQLNKRMRSALDALVSILSRLERRLQPDPHADGCVWQLFQSSAASKDGCNAQSNAQAARIE